MFTKKIFTSILLTITLLSSALMFSCVSENPEDENLTTTTGENKIVTVTVQIIGLDKEEILPAYETMVVHENPNALEALITACEEKDIDIILSGDDFINGSGEYNTNAADESAEYKDYFWRLDLNGVEVKEGKSSETVIKNGDKVVFELTLLELDETDW